jgi:hypothetical protein
VEIKRDSISGRFLPTKPFEERFWEKVNKNGPIMPHMDTPCWEWTASFTTHKYGQLWRREDGYCIVANRASWILHFGEIPDGMLVCHHCDNTKCVRPDHMFLGTNQDNSSDMVKKGRSIDQKGEKNYAAKLTDNDVIQMRLLWESGDCGRDELKNLFNVSKGTINRIMSHRGWKHIKELNENPYIM